MMHVFQMITHLPFDKFIYFPVEVVENAKVEGIMTKLNAAKGKTLLLNINNRIVENVEITRTV